MSQKDEREQKNEGYASRPNKDKRISSLLTRFITGSTRNNASRIINWSIRNMPSGSQTIIVL